MGIINLLTRTCTQTAVYWGTPVDDGYGGRSFADPVEISCRWEDKNQKLTASNGEEFISRSRVFVTQDVDERGYLYLGDLDDLDSGEEADPMTAEGAYEIARFDKVAPMHPVTEFVRTVYLYNTNRGG